MELSIILGFLFIAIWMGLEMITDKRMQKRITNLEDKNEFKR